MFSIELFLIFFTFPIIFIIMAMCHRVLFIFTFIVFFIMFLLQYFAMGIPNIFVNFFFIASILSLILFSIFELPHLWREDHYFKDEEIDELLNK